MPTEPLISILIPVYNVDAYLKRCLDSLAQQTYRNLEIILVDDGSTDGSRKICDTYAKRDQRIMVVHQPNAGPGPARNAALNICHGTYLEFVDADDYFEPDMVQTLYEALVTYQADLAGCIAKTVLPSGRIKNYKCRFSRAKIYEGQEKFLFDMYTNRLPCEVWGKLFKRELFSRVRFHKFKMAEDIMLWLDLSPHIKKAVFLPQRKYCYVRRDASLTSMQTFNENSFDDLVVMRKLQTVLPQISTTLGNVGEARYYMSLVHVIQKFTLFGIDRKYHARAEAFQVEIRENWRRISICPALSTMYKLRLSLIGINLSVYYRIYGFYLKFKYEQ